MGFSLLAPLPRQGYILVPGCSGKPAWLNKNRMSYQADFERFARQLRSFMETSTTAEATLLASPEKLELNVQFSCLALELFGLQFEHNHPYRKICQARHATPATVEHWSHIPAVPTYAFKELELSCLKRSERDVVFFSSGTSLETPSRHFHNRDSLSIYDHSIMAGFGTATAKRSVPNAEDQASITSLHLLSLTPDKAAAAHSSLVYMFDRLGRSGRFSGTEFLGQVARDGSWQLDLPAVKVRLQGLISSRQPIIVVGTAFSFVHLLDYLVEHKVTLSLPPGSAVLETGGYKGRSRSLSREELHQLLSLQLGVPSTNIICEYGMAELSSQAYGSLPLRCGGAHEIDLSEEQVYPPFRFPPWARAQVISPENGTEVAEGQQGLIRVFDLANAYSVMSIQTQDLAIRRGEGFGLLGRSKEAEPRGCSLMATAS